MEYNNVSRIATTDDVKDFFNHLVNERRVNFHPNDRFEDHVSCGDGCNTFSKEEYIVYNRLMDESFDVCEKYGADIYAIGLDFMQNAIE